MVGVSVKLPLSTKSKTVPTPCFSFMATATTLYQPTWYTNSTMQSRNLNACGLQRVPNMPFPILTIPKIMPDKSSIDATWETKKMDTLQRIHFSLSSRCNGYEMD
jgi:hypothetical protein